MRQNDKGEEELDYSFYNNMSDLKSFANRMELLEIRYFGAQGDYIE